MKITYTLKKIQNKETGKEFTFKNYQIHIGLDNGCTLMINVKPTFNSDKALLDKLARPLNVDDLNKQNK